MNEKKTQKIKSYGYLPKDDNIDKIDDEVQEPNNVEKLIVNGKRASNIRGKEIIIAKKPKVPQKKGPIVLYMIQEPDKTVQSKKRARLRETSWILQVTVSWKFHIWEMS